MGFSGAEILIFRGLPSILLTKLEKPLFFRLESDGFPMLLSSEYLLGLVVPLSDRGGVTSIMRSLVVDGCSRCRPLGSGLVCVC